MTVSEITKQKMQKDHDHNRLDSSKPKRVNGKRIIWSQFQTDLKILQIYNKGLEYAILSDDYETCNPLVWCKDFLHDIIHSSLINRPFEIYRLKYNPNTNPKPCLKQARIVVANSRDSRMMKKIPSCIDFINQIEDKLDIPHTIVRSCINPPIGYTKDNVFIFQGNKRWIFAPAMLSLYTLLIRVGFSHFIGKDYRSTISGLKEGLIKQYQSKDARWIKEIEPAFEKIIRLGDRRIFYRDMKLNYPAHMSTDIMHNRMGIVAFANDIRSKDAGLSVIMPYWHLIN